MSKESDSPRPRDRKEGPDWGPRSQVPALLANCPTRSDPKHGALSVIDAPKARDGSEFWDLTLVDPDNRCPVDFHAPQGWRSHYS